MTNSVDRMRHPALVRRVGLRIFSRINPGYVTISHHWTGDRLRLHAFRHKGYWYHGFRRERATMLSLARLLGRGDVVIEAGGHIAYAHGCDYYALVALDSVNPIPKVLDAPAHGLYLVL